MLLRNTANRVRESLVDNLWKSVSTFFLDLFWPIRCVQCSKVGGWLCNDCFSDLQLHNQVCIYCGEPSIGGFTHARCLKPRGLDRLWAPYLYRGPAKSLIATLKYRNCPDVACTVAGLLMEAFNNDLCCLYDFTLVPVPLHYLKRLRRGYNQAVLIANHLSELWHISLVKDLLVRRFYTVSQTSLDIKQRRQNVVNAFVVEESKKQTVRGGKFIVVDDVCTTGATLRACCSCLKRAGAETVWGLTFAKD